MRRILSGIAIGATFLGAGVLGATATPAFAAPQHHKPHVSLTADQIIKKANADLESASSFSVYSSVTEQGTSISTTELVTDQGCQLTVNAPDDISLTLLSIGSQAWVKPSNAFWAELGYTAAQQAGLDGMWVTYSAFSSALGNSSTISGSCSTSSGALAPASGWTLGKKTVRISGQRAWQLVNKKQKATAYVSDTGKPEFLRFTQPGEKGQPPVTEYFSGYNASVTLIAPPASEVLTSIPPIPSPTGASLAIRRIAELTTPVR
jgi:hypothetical protein